MAWPKYFFRGETSREFALGEGASQVLLAVETSDCWGRPAVRLRGPSGAWSDWSQQYETIAVHEGYGVATAWWDGVLRELVPFRIEYAEERREAAQQEQEDATLDDAGGDSPADAVGRAEQAQQAKDQEPQETKSPALTEEDQEWNSYLETKPQTEDST
jgi:hypothetical protein